MILSFQQDFSTRCGKNSDFSNHFDFFNLKTLKRQDFLWKTLLKMWKTQCVENI